jgi:hypothetical protein
MEVIVKAIKNRKKKSPFRFAVAKFKSNAQAAPPANWHIHPIGHFLFEVGSFQNVQFRLDTAAIKQKGNERRNGAIAKVTHRRFLFLRIFSLYGKHLFK